MADPGSLLSSVTDPPEALWILPGFYNGLYLPRSQQEAPQPFPSLAFHHGVFTCLLLLVSLVFFSYLFSSFSPSRVSVRLLVDWCLSTDFGSIQSSAEDERRTC